MFISAINSKKKKKGRRLRRWVIEEAASAPVGGQRGDVRHGRVPQDAVQILGPWKESHRGDIGVDVRWDGYHFHLTSTCKGTVQDGALSLRNVSNVIPPQCLHLGLRII